MGPHRSLSGSTKNTVESNIDSSRHIGPIPQTKPGWHIYAASPGRHNPVPPAFFASPATRQARSQ